MRRRRAIALAVLGIPAVLLLILLLLTAWVAATERGTRWAVEHARPHLPAWIELGRVEGRLIGPLRVEDIDVDLPGVAVRAGQAALEWDPVALLKSQVRVTRLALDDVEVIVREPETGADGAGDDPPDGTGLQDLLPERVPIPVQAVVERFRIRGARIALPGRPERRLETLALAARVGPEGILVEALRLESPLADLSGRLRLAAARPYALEGRVDWAVRPPIEGLAPMQGDLELGGSLEDLALGLRWSEPTALRISARASVFGPAPEWEARVVAEPAAWRRWWEQAPPYATGADLRLGGTFERAGVEGALRLTGLPTPVALELDLDATRERLRIERLHAELPERSEGNADLTGTLDWSGTPRADARLEWQDLAWPLEGTAAVSTPSGKARLSGTLDAYEFEGSGRLRTPRTGQEAVALDWSGRGDVAALDRFRLDARWHRAALEATGAVDWGDARAAEARVELTGFEPQRLVDGLQGTIDTRLTVDGGWGEAPRGSVTIEALEGELQGHPVAGTGRIAHAAGTTRIEALDLRSGRARLQLSGTAGDRLDLAWAIRVPALSEILAGYEGAVEGEGAVTGTPAVPRGAGELALRRFQGAGVQVERATLSGGVAAAGSDPTELQLDVRGLVAPGVEVSALDARLRGTLADHRLTAVVASNRGDAELALRGGLEKGDWDGRLERADLVPAGGAEWTLDSPAPLAWQAPRLAFGRGCWSQASARVCLEATSASGRWQADLDAARVPLGQIAGRWRDDLDYAGELGVSMTLAGAPGEPVTGSATLELGEGRVVGPVLGEETTLLAFGASRIELDLKPEQIVTRGVMPLAPDGRIAIDLRVGRGSDAALDGRVQARVADLSLVGVLVPAIGKLEGELVADVSLGGRVAQPALSGTARLEAGRVGIAPLGVELADLQTRVQTRDEAIEITLGATSGDGRMEATARVQRGTEGWRARGRLVGEDFQAVNLPEATVRVSPELDWSVADRDIEIGGKVAIPGARIEPRDLSGTVQQSPDAVVVDADGDDTRDATGRWRVIADVEVILGDDVRIDAFGLDGRLAGSMRIMERPERLTAASGELRVEEGTYTIYRQTLEIERGRVIFDGGPVADPGLDVRAVRRPRNVLVGANVRGTLREPRVELFSEPPMPESQVLSYLVLGIPLRETSSGQQSTLAAAATALARSEQGGKLASQFGIQEVTVEEGEPGEGASIELGRYLSPRLYVGYGIGLMERANSVRVRYELTERWTLEARSGEDASTELLYTIEVDESADAVPTLPIPDELFPSNPVEAAE